MRNKCQVAVVPVNVADDGSVRMGVRRQRLPRGDEILGLVVGEFDDRIDMNVLRAARRVAEEAGIRATHVEKLADAVAAGPDNELTYLVALLGATFRNRDLEWVALDHPVPDGVIPRIEVVLGMLLVERRSRDPQTYAEWRDA